MTPAEAEALIPTAAAIVGTVRDFSPADTGSLLDEAGVTDDKARALIVTLAAMVDPDAKVGDLLAWVAGPPVESRTFTPPAYDIKNLPRVRWESTADRRRAIAELSNKGLTRQQIADRLDVTIRCVDRHREAIRKAAKASVTGERDALEQAS